MDANAIRVAIMWVCLALIGVGFLAWIACKTAWAARKIGRCGFVMMALSVLWVSIGGVKFQPGLRDAGSDLSTGTVAWAATNRSFEATQPIYVSANGSTNEYMFASSPVTVSGLTSGTDVYVFWHVTATFTHDETIVLGDVWANYSYVHIPYTLGVARVGDTITVEYMMPGSSNWVTAVSVTAQASSGVISIPFMGAEGCTFNVYTSYVPEPPVHTNGVYNVPIARIDNSHTNKYLSTRVPIRVNDRIIMPPRRNSHE